MELPHDSMLLRIFLGELHKWHSQPLYEAIVMRAKGICIWRAPRFSAVRWDSGSRAGCTRRASSGFPEDVPVVIEIVDSEEKINAFLPVLG